MDLSLIPAGLSSISTGISIINEIRKADGAIEKAELKLKLAEIMSALADANIALSTATSHISSLEARIQKREDLSALKTTIYDGLYVAEDGSDHSVDGPFCARCWDVDSQKVRPAPNRTGERGMGYCPECKNVYPMWNADAAIATARAKI
jgi:hypothetical protein